MIQNPQTELKKLKDLQIFSPEGVPSY